MNVRADGIIVSTPTGSTCYAMSVGAPLVDPRVEALVIAPMAPFKFAARPVVVPSTSKITLKVVRPKECVVVIDGQEEEPMAGNETVEFSVSETKARFVTFGKELLHPDPGEADGIPMLEERKVWGIDRQVLEMVNEVGQEQSLPNEFVAALRAEEGVITELLFLPGTMQGEDNATLLLHMLPDRSTSWSARCTPIPAPATIGPSADLQPLPALREHPHHHCLPYDMHSWQAYDMEGNGDRARGRRRLIRISGCPARSRPWPWRPCR